MMYSTTNRQGSSQSPRHIINSNSPSGPIDGTIIFGSFAGSKGSSGLSSHSRAMTAEHFKRNGKNKLIPIQKPSMDHLTE